MKKAIVTAIITVVITTVSTVWASMDMNHSKGHRDSHNHDAISGKMEHMEHKDEIKMPEGMSMKAMNIDGYKVSFHVMTMPAYHTYMENMGHKGQMMGKGATHHIMMDITGQNGKKVESAVVKVKVIDPKKRSQYQALMSMMGNYGANFNMPAKGKYQIMTLFKIDGRKHKGGYWHEVK